MNHTYAGIGSRRTPRKVLGLMTEFASLKKRAGYVLRTGHADGADQAFEEGAGDAAEIFLPWTSFNMNVPLAHGAVVHKRPSPASYNTAAEFHPNWRRLSPAARHLHARNSHQILGWDLKTPVDFVICWTPGGLGGGGTGQALRIAEYYAIDIWDLGDELVLADALKRIKVAV